MNNGIFLKKNIGEKFSKNLAKKNHIKKDRENFEPQTRKKTVNTLNLIYDSKTAYACIEKTLYKLRKKSACSLNEKRKSRIFFPKARRQF